MNSSILTIYSSCAKLIELKQRMLKVHVFPLIEEVSSSQKKHVTGKILHCIKRIVKEFAKQSSAGYYSESKILPVLKDAIEKLKNNKELLTQQEIIQIKAKQLIAHWKQCSDPLLYYELAERKQLKQNLNEIALKVKRSEIKEVRRPLYIRKLEQQLRENIEGIYQQQHKLNVENISKITESSRRLRAMLGKMAEAVGSLQIISNIDLLKNQMLSVYIDTFNRKPQKENDVKRYLKDFNVLVRKIQQNFRNQTEQFEVLAQYIKIIDKEITAFLKDVQTIEGEVMSEVLNISKDLNVVAGFQEALIVADQIRLHAGVFESLKDFHKKSQQYRITINQMEKAVTGSLKMQIKCSNFLEEFISDKKFLEGIAKKETSLELGLLQVFMDFLKKVEITLSKGLNLIKASGDSQRKNSKIINNIFLQIFDGNEEQENSRSSGQFFKPKGTNNFLSEIDTFIQDLSVFDSNEVDWTQSYQCSLGPRLLLHGSLKMLPKGIYFESIFNRSNLFFGRTKLFISKEEILEFTKQSALLIFPDVIEVKTKRGSVYFHTLGKRDLMFDDLTEIYFPEANIHSQQCLELQQFHEFKGDENALKTQIEPFLLRLSAEIGKEQIQNISLARLFHRYYSDEEFVFKGKHYDCFKNQILELIECVNIKKTCISPEIPGYFELKKEPATSQDIATSERIFTYEKSLPMIPFFSKGGFGLCEQRIVYHWGGPNVFVIDLFSTLKGFSLTEGMTVRCRQVFRELNGSVGIQSTAEVNFETQSSSNGFVRSPAISGLKDSIAKTMDMLRKSQKNRGLSQVNKVTKEEPEGESSEAIEGLRNENMKLRRLVRIQWVLLSVVIFLGILAWL